MGKKEYLTIPQLAKLLGISRIAVYKKVQKGEIKVKKAGRMNLIPISYVEEIIGKALSAQRKKDIEQAVKKTVLEYGEVLKMLGRE